MAGSTEASITGPTEVSMAGTADAGPQSAYFVGSLTNATLLRPAFEASARVSAT